MQRDSHGSGVDPRSYVGPYRMDKTLGKGQTGINLNLTSFLLSISLSLSLCFFCLTVIIFSLPPFFLPPLPHQRLSYSFFLLLLSLSTDCISIFIWSPVKCHVLSIEAAGLVPMRPSSSSSSSSSSSLSFL